MPLSAKTRAAGLVLAAGLSRRMGRPKQLIQVRGRVLLAHVLNTVLASPLEPVVLVLGHQADTVRAAIESEGIGSERMKIVINPDYSTGQASSVRVALEDVGPETEGALFIMGDQIGLKGEVIEHILTRAGQTDRPRIIRPEYGGRYGGPVYWPRIFFKRLSELGGDEGGRQIIRSLPPGEVVRLKLPAEWEPTDIDTREDLESWLTRQGE